MDPRALFLEVLRGYLGDWYRWGGSTPAGFDCSGLILEGLSAVGAVPPGYDTTAEGLRQRFPVAGAPVPGALVFYGAPAVHVVAVETLLTDGRAIAIGADGGGPQVQTVADAQAAGAWIKRRPLRPGWSAVRYWWA